MKKKSFHKKSVAYAATTLGASMMSGIFMFYYVNVFLNRFHVTESWFQVSQTVFMVWNAINDPLFGYIQDNFNFSWVRSRRHTILYGAPLFVISFLIPWFPWGDYSQPTNLAGIQLMFSLCFYDALFTFVLLAQCALFAELSSAQEDRLQLVRYSQVASLCGASSVFLTNYLSDNLHNYPLFLLTTVLVGCLALACMVYSGLHSDTIYDTPTNPSHQDQAPPTPPPSIVQQTRQIFTSTSFVSFVLMNLVQVFHITWLNNFTSIVCDLLIPPHLIHTSLRSLFYGLLFALPQVVVIVANSVVRIYGYFVVIRTSFFMKVIFGSVLFLAGPRPTVLMLFFLAEFVNCGAVSSMFNLCLSDVIDADSEKYQRQHPMSSMVFGCNALVTKPAQSLAPMLVVFILNSCGYREYKAGAGDAALLSSAVFTLTCLIPVITGVLQMTVWSYYNIRHTHKVVARHVEA